MWNVVMSGSGGSYPLSSVIEIEFNLLIQNTCYVARALS